MIIVVYKDKQANYPMNFFKSLSKIKTLLCAGISITLLSACGSSYKLEFMVSEEDEVVMRKIVDQINDHSKFEIEIQVQDSLTEVDALHQLQKGKFDLTSVDNTLDFHESKRKLRTVVPFFHEVLVVVSRHEMSQKEVDDHIKTGDYLVLAKESDELDFFKKLIPSFTGDSTINYRLESHFDLKKDLAENNILLFFSALENYELGQMLFKGESYVYSLDHEETFGHGSFIEGFCKSYKKTTPYVLSRYSFGVTLEKPIYTLAVHELLIAQSDLSNKVVYDLIQTIHHHHIVPIFESSNSYTFEVNHQDINLSFPFHEGTLDYVNRDKPSFVERYSEFMGFILSSLILLMGLIASLKATMNQRKKDRMDEYYRELIELKENIGDYNNGQLRDQLTNMQNVVFELLIREKLSANNEFLIFMMLWDEIHHEMMRRTEKPEPVQSLE